MATDFVGTNIEKTDRLVGAVVELRTTVRLCLAAVGIMLPLIIGLLTYLVVQSFGTSAKVERMSERLETTAAKVERLGERLDVITAKLDRLADRVEQLKPAGK